MPEDRIPRHDIDAEEATIGSLLIDPTAIEKVADILQEGDFYSEKTKWLYEACLALYQRGEAINQITVAHELNNRGRLAECGGVAYESFLISVCPTSLDIEYYAEIVHKMAVMRRLIGIGEQIVTIGYSNTSSIEEAVDQTRALIDSIKPAKSKYLELSNLRILKSKPPHYKLNVNGTDLSLTLGELQQWGRFRTKILSELDFIPIKPKVWDSTVNKLLEHAQKMEAPIDTSAEVETRLSVRHWFEQRGPGEEYSDIQSGCYAVVSYRGQETNFEQREFWAFQPTPLLRWLKRDLNRTVSRDSLWSMVTGWGGIKHQWRVGKNTSVPIRLWAVPPSFAESAEFATEKEEKQEELPIEEQTEEELPDI